MRSRSSLLLLAIVAACGTDADTQCAATSYSTVGEPYLASWCRGCHSVDLPPGMRQAAPVGVNFDTLADVRAQLLPLQTSIANGTMPPEGGPSAEETAMMMTWLTCGAP